MGKENSRFATCVFGFVLVVRGEFGTLLCQPLGGLNDVFCQVFACLSYAERESRELVIETEFNKFWMEPFDRAFKLQASVPIHYADTKKLSRLPKAARTVIERQTLNYEGDRQRVDFQRSSDKRMLRHRASGGGLSSLKLLPRISFTPWSEAVIAIAERELSSVKYRALNIRNADYYLSDINQIRADIPEKLSELDPTERLLIVSDDESLAGQLDLVDHASYLDHKKLYSQIASEVGPSQLIQPLVDLAIMVNATKLKTYPFEGFKHRYSGFSRLGKALWVAKNITAPRTFVAALVNSDAISDFGSRHMDALGRAYFLGQISRISGCSFLDKLIFCESP